MSNSVFLFFSPCRQVDQQQYNVRLYGQRNRNIRVRVSKVKVIRAQKVSRLITARTSLLCRSRQGQWLPSNTPRNLQFLIKYFKNAKVCKT